MTGACGRWAALLASLALAAAVRAGATTGSAPAGGPSISAYDLRVDARADGSGLATLVVTIDRAGESVVLVPVGFAEIRGLTLAQGPAGTSVAAERAGGQSNLRVSLPAGGASPVTVTVSADVAAVVTEPAPAGRSLHVALLNSQPPPIRNVRLAVTFPPGLRGHAIREALPKSGKSETTPRAWLDRIDGRSGARLRADSLAQGETASLQIDLAAASPPIGWLLAGLALAVLYLVSFRDLVASRPAQGASHVAQTD